MGSRRFVKSAPIKEYMSGTSFEDRVMDLCSRTVAAEDDKEIQQLAAELRQILHERIEQLRSRLVLTPGYSRPIDLRSTENPEEDSIVRKSAKAREWPIG